MADAPELTNFERLGIDVNSSQMIMLKAIMSAAGGTSIPVTYNEIDDHIEKIHGKKFSRAYIYRQLKQLEDEGYISSEQELGHARGYQILESEIIKMLTRKKEDASLQLVEKKKKLTQELALLQTVNAESAACKHYNHLMGLAPTVDSIAIEGIENVRSTVIREFGNAATPGDEIRVIAPANILGPGRLEQAGMAELSLITRAADGVKIIGLMIPAKESPADPDLFIEYLAGMVSQFTQLASTGNIILRISKNQIQTYRMVSLNREKMLLYLTHAADSDMAALIHRKDNPGLIDDAVDTFDRIFNESIDILELIRQAMAKRKESMPQ